MKPMGIGFVAALSEDLGVVPKSASGAGAGRQIMAVSIWVSRNSRNEVAAFLPWGTGRKGAALRKASGSELRSSRNGSSSFSTAR